MINQNLTGAKSLSDQTNMTQKAAVFEKTYQDYLSQLEKLDLSKKASLLGIDVSGDELLIPLFGSVYRVSSAGVISPKGQQADFARSVVFFKYILMCPKDLPGDSAWATYHSFKDAQPLLGYFARETTNPIGKCFTGKLMALEHAGSKLGGSTVTDNASYDLSILFEALPKIPLFLRFNDKDEEFPAQCTMLFKSSVSQYLDMESLGILGALFAKNLIANA
jgi:hypothetical protein